MSWKTVSVGDDAIQDPILAVNEREDVARMCADPIKWTIDPLQSSAFENINSLECNDRKHRE